MKNLSLTLTFVSVALLGVHEQAFGAPPTPQESLAACQKAISAETVKYIAKKTDAVSDCLSAASEEMIEFQTSTVSAEVAEKCVAKLRKIYKGSAPALISKFRSNVLKKCDPSVTSSLTHTWADFYGSQGTASDLNFLCNTKFGNDGQLNDFNEYLDCAIKANDWASARSIFFANSRSFNGANPSINETLNAINALPIDAAQKAEALAVLTEVFATFFQVAVGG